MRSNFICRTWGTNILLGMGLGIRSMWLTCLHRPRDRVGLADRSIVHTDLEFYSTRSMVLTESEWGLSLEAWLIRT